ncbi:hypothetical protein [Streptomyces sp. YIM S03343]
MIRRKTLAVAAAAALLGGLGTYGATAAFASSSDASPRATASATVSRTSDAKDSNSMIQQCVKHLPAKDRAAAEKQMREMMAHHGNASEHSGTGHHSGTSTSGMMGNASADSMTDMTHGGS